MSTTTTTPRRSFSRLERAILAVHGVFAAAFGVIGFLGADDPDWGDLQRLVVIMLVGVWVAGVAASAALAWRVNHRGGRVALLLAGPGIVFVLVFGRAIFGWA
jgi:hypothetical protein